MTLARIQPFCKKYNINIGYYKRSERKILPRTYYRKRQSFISA